MPISATPPSDRQLTKMVVFGLSVVGLYVLLYLFEDQIMAYSTHGRWYFIIPIIIAFIVSFLHGNFTSYFWDVLGIKAKK